MTHKAAAGTGRPIAGALTHIRVAMPAARDACQPRRVTVRAGFTRPAARLVFRRVWEDVAYELEFRPRAN
ncbi:hypothetical protein EVAR_12952_1 [Eumeta japonica]|uniref:Uncharacterized protein n=1 Tax=Eumeta variegata TaxID=151549 RepID=A0A4C1TW74_EUMVA|nr:hypothetical protein EVAR_12952_1 [Eumeta japonica]